MGVAILIFLRVLLGFFSLALLLHFDKKHT